MAGIYIHIPYCKKRCHYCDFYKTVNLKNVDDFISSLLKEIELKANFFLPKTPIETIYFGGGTPSILTINALNNIFTALHKNFTIQSNAEITLELNPDDISLDYMISLFQIGVNRVSIGIQSFDNEFLQLMNRRHTVEQAFAAVENSVKSGIENISIDLIYGLPNLNEKQWKSTLEMALTLPVQHLSAYHLTYETGTVFYNWLKNGILKEMDEDLSWRQFEMLHEMAENKGFEHYEISNFAQPQKYSKHNSSYWQGIPYLGLGPSAHSYNNNTRSWNVSDLEKYIIANNNNSVFWEEEILTAENHLTEFIMTSLRTNNGLNIESFENKFGLSSKVKLLEKAQKYISLNQLKIEENHLKFSLSGWFIMDKILTEIV